MASLVKNGITVENLEQEWHDGFNAGWAEATPGITEMIYAAVALTLHERLHFGKSRICAFMGAMDQHVITTMSAHDAIEEVWEKAGIEMNFKEPFDRIQEVDEAKPWRRKK